MTWTGALALVAAQAPVPDALQGAQGEAKLRQWTALLGQGKVVQAAEMMGPSATFRYNPSREKVTMPSAEFVKRLAGCKPAYKTGPTVNFTMPGRAATWNYSLLCPKLARKAGDRGDIGFFLSASAGGVRAW